MCLPISGASIPLNLTLEVNQEGSKRLKVSPSLIILGTTKTEVCGVLKSSDFGYLLKKSTEVIPVKLFNSILASSLDFSVDLFVVPIGISESIFLLFLEALFLVLKYSQEVESGTTAEHIVKAPKNVNHLFLFILIKL
ncbi:UNVERIFIED_CONTAM: hypothetical protein O8I53_07920 [Campylobacter lari]